MALTNISWKRVVSLAFLVPTDYVSKTYREIGVITYIVPKIKRPGAWRPGPRDEYESKYYLLFFVRMNEDFSLYESGPENPFTVMFMTTSSLL
jgi:hypothetical protein